MAGTITARAVAKMAMTLLLAFGIGGCRHRAAGPARAPATARVDQRRFEDREHGFAVMIPAQWSSRQDPQNVLTLAGPGGVELDIAVPKLPAHIPGFIPLAAVKSGYVDDLKKRLKDVTVSDERDLKIDGAAAHEFTAAGAAQDGPHKLSVLLITRNDRLYIVAGEAPAKEFSKVQDAVNLVAAGWKWIK
jgi:hypothetical protein